MFGNCCNNGLSVPVVAGLNTNAGYNNGDDWWAWIIMLALFAQGGFGGFGFGNQAGATTQATEAAIQRGFDTQAVITKLDGINNGICSLGYDQLAQMNGINTNIMQTGFGLQRDIQAGTVAGMQNYNSLSSQLANCCCENREAIAQVRYDMATNDCAIKTLVNQVAQQIQWGQSNGFRDLSDLINQQFCALRMEQKDAIIAELQSKLNNCDRDTALQGLATYIINQVRPTPIPSWSVQNPWAGCGCGYSNNCCGNGCGC